MRSNENGLLSHGSELYIVQAYRALAVVLVVLFHGSSIVNDRYGEAPLDHSFRFGFSGVLLFFVISGFIISYAHRDDMGSGRFYYYLIRRAVRIYPLYWFVFIFIGAWRWYCEAIRFPDLLSNAFLFHAQKTWVIPVSWTLHYELVFYLLFSSFIFSKRLGIIIVILWVFSYSIVPDNIDWALCHPISSLFILGIMGALLVLKLQRLSSRSKNNLGFLSLLIGIGFFLFSVRNYGLMGFPDAWPKNWTILMGFGLASWFLVVSSISPALNGIAVRLTPITCIGNASYSIYLIHMQLERATIDLAKLMSSGSQGIMQLSENAMLMIAASAAILGGILLHRTIELPILKALREMANRWEAPNNIERENWSR